MLAVQRACVSLLSSQSQVMARLVMVDDMDPSIQYSGGESGPWTGYEVNNTLNDLGFRGTPFQKTLHGVNVSASFTFPFNGMSHLLYWFNFEPLTLSSFSGSGVTVYGTSITTNASGTQDPTWECFIDNKSIGWDISSDSGVGGSQNNWILCGAGPFQDGPHMLTVNANVSNQQTFWFDQIQYTPSASVQLLDQRFLYIDSGDSAIQYTSGWSPPGGSGSGLSYTQGPVNGTSTNSPGSFLTYQFSGS